MFTIGGVSAPRPLRVVRTVLAGAGLVAALSGCAALPSSGPTARGIVEDAHGARNILGYQVIDLTDAVTRSLQVEGATPPFAAFGRQGPADRLGPGDMLQITVFEIGASLFSTGSQLSGAMGQFPPMAAAGQSLPPVMVAQDGSVTLPYVGRLTVSGRSVEEVEALIEAGLKGKSQAPQVIVSVRDSIFSTVVVMGEVKKPGRLPLTLSGDRLLDAVAAAGGAASPAGDVVVRFTRGAKSAEMRLDMIRAGSAADVALQPQDRIELLKRPRSFTVFGATGKVSQAPFVTDEVNLAEALATTGGPSDQAADPSAVFVFRYESGSATADVPGTPRPVIYRLNLGRADGYFLAQKFAMRDHDVLYVANAESNAPTKLIQIINLVFSPFYTAKVISQ